MINPTSLMRFVEIKNKFTKNHPKFAAFLQRIFSQRVMEGDIIEITVTREGEEPITANMRVMKEDLEILEEIKNMR